MNGQLTCGRCGRSVKRSHATGVRIFWSSECVANEGKADLRAVARSMAVWDKTKQQHQEIVDKIGTQHGHPLLWCGLKYAPVRCVRCEWRAPLFELIRQSRTDIPVPRCTRNPSEVSKIFAEVQTWVRKYEKRKKTTAMHQWECHSYTAHCTKCGIYVHRLTKAPRGEPYYAKDNCGALLPNPWSRVYKDTLASGRSLQVRRQMFEGI